MAGRGLLSFTKEGKKRKRACAPKKGKGKKEKGILRVCCCAVQEEEENILTGSA